MSVEIRYTRARAHFAELCDRVIEDREIVVIRRRNGADVALIAEDELAGLLETAYRLRSPRGEDRLLSALADVRDAAGGEPPAAS